MTEVGKVSFTDLNDRTCDALNTVCDSFHELGAVVVTDIPDLGEKRITILRKIKIFGDLPDAVQSKFVRPNLQYAIGWSSGKEKMRKGRIDSRKGSFYANFRASKLPQERLDTDVPLSSHSHCSDALNLFPDEEISGFSRDFYALTEYMYSIGLVVLELAERGLLRRLERGNESSAQPTILKNGSFLKALSDAQSFKARLLHYRSRRMEDSHLRGDDEDDLCSWHTDSGCFTALCAPLYLDDHGSRREMSESGLLIRGDDGAVHVDIPRNAMAFQIGEILQVWSKGYYRAAPHCVKSAHAMEYDRTTCAVFFDLDPHREITVEDENNLQLRNLPDGIPLLTDRLRNGMRYGDFLKTTYEKYY